VQASQTRAWSVSTRPYHNRCLFLMEGLRTNRICMQVSEGLLLCDKHCLKMLFASTKIKQTLKTGSARIATRTCHSSTAFLTTIKAESTSSSKFVTKTSFWLTSSTKIWNSKSQVQKSGLATKEVLKQQVPSRFSKTSSTRLPHVLLM
jgi:hypothetical protein